MVKPHKRTLGLTFVIVHWAVLTNPCPFLPLVHSTTIVCILRLFTNPPSGVSSVWRKWHSAAPVDLDCLSLSLSFFFKLHAGLILLKTGLWSFLLQDFLFFLMEKNSFMTLLILCLSLWNWQINLVRVKARCKEFKALRCRKLCIVLYVLSLCCTIYSNYCYLQTVMKNSHQND